MINFRFILNPDTDNIEVDEPVGFSDLPVEIERSAKYHGISVAYGADDLEFIGSAAEFIKEQYDLFGVDADVEIQVIAECDGVAAWDETFRLDFGQYSEGCGSKCSVKIGIEQISCFQKFTTGMDKKVDLDATTGFDGSGIPPLPAMKWSVQLPSKTILKSSEGYVKAGTDAMIAEGGAVHYIRPIFTDTKYESLKTSQLAEPSVPFSISNDEIVSPYILYEDNPACFSGTFNALMRLKGDVHVFAETAFAAINNIEVVFIKTVASYQPYVDESKILARQIVFSGIQALPEEGLTYPFDVSYSNPALTLEEGENIFGFVFVEYVGPAVGTKTTVTFAPETGVKIEGLSNCPPTTASLFMPFEVLQRVADVITDSCIKVDSRFYGRTDTPTVYTEDGCGAFRSLTSGLFIRRAPEAKVFVSMKEILEGLQPIDAIGFGLEVVNGVEVFKVEPVEYFYQDKEVLSIDGVNKVDKKVLMNETYGTVKVGFDKWQAESINGLDEFNSTREYRSTTRNAMAPLDLISKFITGGYLIELTRIQNFATSGAADTKFDNDLFLIQLKRDAEGLMIVEQGIPLSAVNVFDPPTVYNFRVSPVRNLLRWWNWISGNSFRWVDSGALMFNAGTGNYLAAGFIPDLCSPEAGILAESNDITQDALKSSAPIVRNESVTFETPMSLDEFSNVRANPYGYISFRCNGEWQKGYITKMTYRMAKGKATIELRNAYPS